jgi:hypothetical protein
MAAGVNISRLRSISRQLPHRVPYNSEVTSGFGLRAIDLVLWTGKSSVYNYYSIRSNLGDGSFLERYMHALEIKSANNLYFLLFIVCKALYQAPTSHAMSCT